MAAGATARTAPDRRVSGVGLGVMATLLLLAALTSLPDDRLVPLMAVALALGASFILLDYGFTGGFRSFLVDGDGRTLASSFIVPAVAALVIIPVAGFGGAHGRYVAPIGVSLVAGAALFGVGMLLSNGCGSGTLVAAGQGSRRMWITLPFFSVGGVIGSLMLPSALRLPSLGAVDFPSMLGPIGGLAVTEAIIAVAALLFLRGRAPPFRRLASGAVIGALAGLYFLVSGEPWGVTMALTLWGAKPLQAVGLDLSATEFWSWGWARAQLDGPVLAMHGSVGNLGVMLGSLIASAATGRLRHAVPITRSDGVASAFGGLAMGIGARLSFGCNVGAFLGGLSSGSLHGLVWLLAALPGCWLGLKLRDRQKQPRPT